jgi:hypothetical protein
VRDLVVVTVSLYLAVVVDRLWKVIAHLRTLVENRR